MISIDADAVADAVDVAGADVQLHTATHGPTQLHNDCTATGYLAPTALIGPT